MSGSSGVLCPLCAVIVLTAAGSGGIPVPCKQDVCLEGFINKTFHRIHLKCCEVTTDLTVNGDVHDQNVSFIPDTGCLTWTPGGLSHCKVIETDDNGMKTNVPVAYRCKPGFDLSTTAAPTMTATASADEKKSFELSTTAAPTMPPAASADEKKRHHLLIVAAVLLLSISLVCSMKYFRCLRNVKHKPPSLVVQRT